MSCNGCRVLRKGCGDNCVLRPCLQWIQPPEAQAHATLFLSNFFGRSDLLTFLSDVPSGHRRTALFQSLLFEAVGRTVNPVNGAMGLLATGNWQLCQAGVQTVLAGGTPAAINGILVPEVDESSEEFQASVARSTAVMMRNLTDAGNADAIPPISVVDGDDGDRDDVIMPESDVAVDVAASSQCSDGEEPKLLKLFE